MKIIPRPFYLREDVVEIALDLLGKFLVTRINGVVTAGMICETEAYAGVTDRASHAFAGRRTSRTEVMYAIGGTAYVYLCYGIHSLFNVVTNHTGVPHAILIRGIIPFDNIPVMLSRAGLQKLTPGNGIGPGKVSKLLGIHYSHSGLDLVEMNEKKIDSIWIEDRNRVIPKASILSGPRIGVDYAGTDAALPYRFWFNHD